MTTEPTTRTLPAGYMEQAASTAIYSPQWSVLYPALGLGNEAAEFADKLLDGAPRQDILAELGDVLWYVSALARDARVTQDELFWTPLGDSFTDPAFANRTMLLRGLLAAAGTAQGHVKKALRDHDGDLSERREGLVYSLRDLLMYADAIATSYIGGSLDQVAADNLTKLAGRAARQTLTGDGDVR